MYLIFFNILFKKTLYLGVVLYKTNLKGIVEEKSLGTTDLDSGHI